MRCSSTAGFHGRSRLTTVERLEVEADAARVGGEEDTTDGSDLNRAISFGRSLDAIRRAGTRDPTALAHGLGHEIVHARHWLKMTTRVSAPPGTPPELHELVNLVAAAGLVIDQVGAVAGHAHDLEGDGEPPLIGFREKLVAAPFLDEARHRLPLARRAVSRCSFVMGRSSGSLCDRATGRAPCPSCGAAGRGQGSRRWKQDVIAHHLAGLRLRHLVGVPEAEQRPQTMAVDELHDGNRAPRGGSRGVFLSGRVRRGC